MNFSRNTRIALALMLAAGLFPRLSMAEPAASSLPASVLPQSAAIMPVEAPSERALRAEVTDVQGEVSVQVRDKQELTALTQGMELRSGDLIKTGQGSCRLLIDGKTKVSVMPLTSLKKIGRAHV